MPYKVQITPLYEQKLDNIISYLIQEFSLQYCDKYLTYLEKQIEALETFPYIGIETNDPNLRGCRILISKQNYILYYINEEKQTITLRYITSANENYLNLK